MRLWHGYGARPRRDATRASFGERLPASERAPYFGPGQEWGGDA